MKRKLCALTLLAFTVAAFYGNFDKFWSGHDPAGIGNFLLSAGYLAAWGWFLREPRSKKTLWFARIWWMLSLTGVVSWLGLQYLSFPEIFLFLAWPGALFLSQLFGLRFLFHLSYGGLYLLFLVICVVMLFLSMHQTKTTGGNTI